MEATLKKEVPVVEATTKTGKVWAEEEAWTTRLPMGVVELMPKDWEVLVQTKLELVAIVPLPWPNRTELAARVCRVMLGVAPPLEATEPLPVTEVTPPTVGLVVEITMPAPFTARKLPADTMEPVKKDCPVVVALVKMEEEALRLVVLTVVALWVVPENKVMPKILEFKVMLGAVPPEELMLPLPVTPVTVPL